MDTPEHAALKARILRQGLRSEDLDGVVDALAGNGLNVLHHEAVDDAGLAERLRALPSAAAAPRTFQEWLGPARAALLPTMRAEARLHLLRQWEASKAAVSKPDVAAELSVRSNLSSLDKLRLAHANGQTAKPNTTPATLDARHRSLPAERRMGMLDTSRQLQQVERSIDSLRSSTGGSVAVLMARDSQVRQLEAKAQALRTRLGLAS